MSDTRDLELLYEIDAIRHISRMWQRFYGIDFANLAEHHFSVAWIALLIAKHEGVKNTDKILKMALVHDIAESRTGDVDYLARQYTERNEEKGIKDMFDGTVLEDEFVEIWHEYEDRESIEAKVVKDADNIHVDLELMEQSVKGVNIGDVKLKMRKKVAKELYTKTARELFKRILESNPHDWHSKSPRNRLHGGDWKELKK